MRPIRCALRAALPVALVAAVLTTGTGTAAAADDLGFGVVARGNLTISVRPDGVEFCFHGERDAGWTETGEWTMSLSGTIDGRPFVGPTWTGYLLVADHCEFVSTAGSVAGDVNVDAGYVGVGSYVVGRSVGGAAWHPTFGTRPYWFNPLS